MKTNIIIATAIAGLAMVSCNKEKFPYGIKANNDIVEETRYVSEFEDVDFNMPGKLFIRQDSSAKQPQIVIKTSSNIMEYINTDVKNDALKIDDDKCIRKLKTFEVYLVVKDIEDITLNGSGDIITQNKIKADDISFNISGSGSVDADVEADDVLLSINGSGSMDVVGSTHTLDVQISGSGDVHTYDLAASQGYVDISGSGDCEVNVADNLDVFISGSGSVFYLGNPRLKINTSGSGSVQAK